MADYNPNSVWGSRKEKTPSYTPPEVHVAASPAEPETPVVAHVIRTPDGPSFWERHGLMLFGIGIVILIGIAAYIYYLLLPPTAPNLSITFSDPGTVIVGEPFPVTITVANNSESEIDNAQLTVTLPQGLSFVATGTTPDQRALTIPIGKMSSKTVNPPQTINLIVTGGGGGTQTLQNVQTVNVALVYGTATTAKTQFQTTASTAITIGSSAALSLSYNAPSSIFSGQNFDLAVNYTNNTGMTLQNIVLSMQYPPAYRFVTASGTMPTDQADSLFPVGSLAPGETRTLIITGNLTGPNQMQYQLNGTIGAGWGGETYPSMSAPANFVVTPSPLSFGITVNSTSTYVAKLSDGLHYVISYTNNSPVAFQALSITATLNGQMYDLASLKTNGAFNSQNNTITWYAATTPGLASLAPGQSGSVDFTVMTKKAFPIKLPSNNNFQLSVAARIQSPTVPPNTAGSSTVSVASNVSKVAGAISLGADGFVAEKVAPSIKNSGPYPPRVNQPSTYTIHWSITNYSTEMKNVTVSAYLQSGTTFTGAVSSPSGTTFTVNPGTGLVTWTIPDVPATTGVISAPATVVFQVSNTPAVNEVSQQVTLLGTTHLTATDAFTGLPVSEDANAITTRFPNDPSVSSEIGAVTQ